MIVLLIYRAVANPAVGGRTHTEDMIYPRPISLLFSFGLIRNNVCGLGFQFTLYPISNGAVGELTTYANKQITKSSFLDCAMTCAALYGCRSLMFDSKADQCYLLSRGFHQDTSKPEIPQYIKVYTRRVEKCSDSGYQDLSVSGTCIKVYSEKKSHLEAVKECQKDGGYLVRLTSRAKRDEVQGFVAYMSSLAFYIDGSDAEKEDEWRLSDGEPFYLNWSAN